jgi:hypothetical protein
MGVNVTCVPCEGEDRIEEKNTLQTVFNGRLKLSDKLKSNFSKEVFMALSILRDSPSQFIRWVAEA